MPRRKKVNEEVGTFDGYELDGTFTSAILKLTALHEHYGEECTIDYAQCQYDDGYEFKIYRKRDETKEEREARLKKDRDVKSNREKWDREQYVKLKKKYGDT